MKKVYIFGEADVEVCNSEYFQFKMKVKSHIRNMLENSNVIIYSTLLPGIQLETATVCIENKIPYVNLHVPKMYTDDLDVEYNINKGALEEQLEKNIALDYNEDILNTFNYYKMVEYVNKYIAGQVDELIVIRNQYRKSELVESIIKDFNIRGKKVTIVNYKEIR